MVSPSSCRPPLRQPSPGLKPRRALALRLPLLGPLVVAAGLACAVPTPGARGQENAPAATQEGASSSSSSSEQGQGQGQGQEAAFLNVTFDAEKGRALLRLPAADERGVHATFLMVAGIETGLGANDVGLDRGQMGGARLVQLRSVGGRVLLEEINTGFRAESGSALEAEAARQSFATSVLFGAEPEPDSGGALVDLTGLLVRDAHGIARTLQSTGQGSYALAKDRSALDVGRCRSFPNNIEFASVLTFTSSKPGRLARATAPDGGALTFVQRIGFVELPDEGYARRRFDPRMGAFSTSFLDYGVDLAEPIAQRLAVRHRIERDPATGEPQPIVYYVDRAAPEPIRTALVEGASWWAQAFEDAGYPGLFQVQVAPEGLDPLDVRHNVIQWVHRSTRGWSYGNAISDPRTGEILKGHVSLGSLRVRQDRLLFEGLLGTAKTGSGEADDPIELSLARIRQLSAHEVGHTLGLAHNFAASTAERASVMDYPAPRVSPNGEGGIDVSDAYAVGIGDWDRHAIRMLYAEVPEDQSVEAFYELGVRAARSRGLRYLTDADARSAGASQPLANLWDDGADPVQSLLNALNVRRIAMESFGRDRIRPGQALAELEEVFVPVYLHHRYQVDAALKGVAGLDYSHGLNALSGESAKPVSREAQSAALDVLLFTLEPDTLRIPRGVAELFLPRPPGFGSSRETFARRTGAAFDWLGAADVAARVTVRGLMNGERLLRAEQQAARYPTHAELDAGAILTRLFTAVGLLGNPPGEPASGEEAALRRVVQVAAVEEAMRTYASASTARPVREAIRSKLVEVVLVGRMAARHGALQYELESLLERPWAALETAPAAGAVESPPGSPIGWPSEAAGCGCHLGPFTGALSFR